MDKLKHFKCCIHDRRDWASYISGSENLATTSIQSVQILDQERFQNPYGIVFGKDGREPLCSANAMNWTWMSSVARGCFWECSVTWRSCICRLYTSTPYATQDN